MNFPDGHLVWVRRVVVHLPEIYCLTTVGFSLCFALNAERSNAGTAATAIGASGFLMGRIFPPQITVPHS